MTAELRTPTREDDAWWAEQLGCKPQPHHSLLSKDRPMWECRCPHFPHGSPSGFSSTGPVDKQGLLIYSYAHIKPYATAPTWETTMGEIVPWMNKGWHHEFTDRFVCFWSIGRPGFVSFIDIPESPETIMQAAAQALGRE